MSVPDIVDLQRQSKTTLLSKASSLIFEEKDDPSGGYLGDLYVEKKDDSRVLAVRETIAGVPNLLLFITEALRNAYHDGDIKLEKIIPLQTEGVIGYVDQHIGNSLETLGFIYGYRFPIEGLARLIEGMTDKKVNPNAKMALAIFLGTATTMGLEFMGGNSGFDDWFGSLFAGLWASGSWAVSYYLSKPRETNVFEELSAKLNKQYEMMIEGKQNINNKLESAMEWGHGLFNYGQKQFETILDETKLWGDDFVKVHSRSVEYLESEGTVARLMLQEFVRRQLTRQSRVNEGEDVVEV